MSQHGSESEIWDYKPLKKTKKRSCKSQTRREYGTKRRKDSNPGTSVQKTEVNSAETHTGLDQNGNNAPVNTVNSGSLDVNHVTLSQEDVQEKDPQSGGFCPVCQMPFSLLVVQSQQWHVAECLDNPSDNCKECPDGLHCTSFIPNHYKRYSHSLLAESRALNDCTTQAISDFSLKSVNNVAPASGTESSVDSTVNVSASSSQSSSPGDGPKGTPTQSNALLLLRSPNTEDIKKKKGWSPSVRSSQSQNSSQESRMKNSTPVKAHCFDNAVQTQTNEVKAELFACNDDDYISYSPLSELPNLDQEHRTQKTNMETPSTALQENENEVDDDDSLKLFSDEDDDLLYNMLDQYETGSMEHGPHKNSLDTCEKLHTSLAPNDHLTTSSSTGVSDGTFRHGPRSIGKESATNPNSQQSPQSVVLECLRERISNPVHTNSFINQELSSTQTTPTQKTPSMAPRRTQTKAGPSGLKQTDIGVFFGLKPLKEKKAEEEVKATVRETDQQGSRRARISEAQGEDAKLQGRRRRKSKAPSEVSSVSPAAEDGTTRPTQTQGKRGVGAERQKRWNRGRATDGGPQEPKRCPFYKKIPGTGFAVDAFQYGVVEGVTAYFLTHFHSDHYGGLKKDSVLPIYCNKITGNLVKSKLKVGEQYVHVLPMNTECVVQGVKVTLLDANHCPGAAMLLFVLPDGQTVLHTGDFRADPSMERYPELQGLRIQTLYLDTTYCSPEYTFPTQQEVITFAVNTAFEQVTLNPRTLVVCGTYAVGKEKVFLAVSEVLGSKVCLSKDKYNAMCCLDSEEIGQRITTDWRAAQVHVLPMMQLNFKNLRTHLNKFSRQYDQLVAFKPTGWTFNQTVRVEDIQPQTQENISIYGRGIPYSEHSSFLELKRFVQWLQPKKILPTVNVGSWRSRKAMEGFFREWQTEPKNLSSTSCALRNSRQ
ncbi:DNA cross-link repair 1A protein isoform X1 [Carassius gibelio]|uniref:DNA cross-link repair 1A protein isoform X1 n=1 Tax=Carassius gibelio TaxID=101364 RepID=UPI002277D512|nr:DNA cross-link repair 1A protein isoform X1 [Carassius gibelio]